MRHKTVWVYNEAWFTDERMLFFSSQNHEIGVCTEFELSSIKEEDEEQEDEGGERIETVVRKRLRCTHSLYRDKTGLGGRRDSVNND